MRVCVRERGGRGRERERPCRNTEQVIHYCLEDLKAIRHKKIKENKSQALTYCEPDPVLFAPVTKGSPVLRLWSVGHNEVEVHNSSRTYFDFGGLS